MLNYRFCHKEKYYQIVHSQSETKINIAIYNLRTFDWIFYSMKVSALISIRLFISKKRWSTPKSSRNTFVITFGVIYLEINLLHYSCLLCNKCVRLPCIHAPWFDIFDTFMTIDFVKNRNDWRTSHSRYTLPEVSVFYCTFVKLNFFKYMNPQNLYHYISGHQSIQCPYDLDIWISCIRT